MSKKDEKEKYEQHVASRGGCTRTNWDLPCANVRECGRAGFCLDKYKTGHFSRKSFLARFRKK
ncbi:MAG: hypothetical protein HZA04_10320 [Nitrospinae bacterium]|nr:hypothetical protein [Nitrospinota bacterium]